MDKRTIRPDDLTVFKAFGDARVSPDGSKIAFVKQVQEPEKERARTDIFLVDVETYETRRLTNSGKDRSPRWSPDGKKVAFISERSVRSQLWLIDVDGGEAYSIPTKQAVQGDIVFAPDGKSIYFNSTAFSKDDAWSPYPGAPEDDRERAVEQASRALKAGEVDKKDGKKPNDIKVITRLRYRMDGMGYFGDLRRHVFRADIPEATENDKEIDATQVTSGDFDHSNPAVSPDGKYVLVSAVRKEDADFFLKSDLWVFDVSSKQAVLLYDAPGPTHNAKWSPDGSLISFFGHDQKRGISTRTDLFVLPVETFMQELSQGRIPDPLTAQDAINLTAAIDRAPGSLGGAEPGFGRGGDPSVWDGSTLYFGMVDRGESYIYKWSPVDTARTPGKCERAFGSEGRAISGFHISGGTLAFTASTPVTPEDLYMFKSGTEVRITNDNDELTSTLSMGAWEKFQYKTDDGQDLDGWLIYPANYQQGNRYPLLLLVHGGPHGFYGSGFMFGAQLFSSMGYAVAYCNPRGSSSYGQEFMAIIDGDWGNKDYTDVMSCVGAVEKKGLVDRKNIFVHGWSYGGYWTVWAVTQTHLFKAACAGACVSNLHSDYGTSDIMWADEHEYGGKPWEKADLLLDRSALSHVENVKTPILLLHGENDLRCPISQSEQFYVALKRLGKTAVFVRYPGEYHGLRRPLHRIDRYKRMAAWFNHYRNQEQ